LFTVRQELEFQILRTDPRGIRRHVLIFYWISNKEISILIAGNLFQEPEDW